MLNRSYIADFHKPLSNRVWFVVQNEKQSKHVLVIWSVHAEGFVEIRTQI